MRMKKNSPLSQFYGPFRTLNETEHSSSCGSRYARCSKVSKAEHRDLTDRYSWALSKVSLVRVKFYHCSGAGCGCGSRVVVFSVRLIEPFCLCRVKQLRQKGEEAWKQYTQQLSLQSLQKGELCTPPVPAARKQNVFRELGVPNHQAL